MDEKKGIVRVRVGLAFNPEIHIKQRMPDASFIPTTIFTDALYPIEEKFRSAIITHINDELGLDSNWKVIFNQFDETGEIYECRIKCSSVEDFIRIRNIVAEKINHVRIRQFMYDGAF